MNTRTIILRICIIFQFCVSVTKCAGLQYYIATNGIDSNPGTKDQPFLTLEAARNAIRIQKTKVPLTSNSTVWLRGGIYTRSNTFQLLAQDSGSTGALITYSSFQGESARIIGGRMITNFEIVTNLYILKRLSEIAKTNILVANLSNNGITNYGTIIARGVGCSMHPAHLELFFNGAPMTLARWPNAGQWDKIAGIPSAGAISESEGNITNGFYYSGDRPRLWGDLSNIWIHGYWDYDWADSYQRIQTFDFTNHLIKTASPYGVYGFKTAQRFYYFNILEELDQPGEYFVDAKDGVLYFWPPSQIGHAEVLASVLEDNLVSVSQTTNIAFAHLAFEATRGSAFFITNAVNTVLSNLTIRLIGNNAIQVSGGTSNTIINCDITQEGDCGVLLAGGDRSTLAPGGHLIQNCHFAYQGRWSRCYSPPIRLTGVGLTACNNLVENQPHVGIMYEGNEHRIEFNEITSIAQETGDVGAIYTGRDFSYRGNIIRYNYLHDISGPGLYGSMGVYMDDCVSGTLIYGNIFYRMQTGVLLGGGRDHCISNNIFIACNPAISIDARGLSSSSSNMVYTSMKQRLDAVPHSFYRSRYSAINDLDKYFLTTSGVPPENNLITLNICTSGTFTNITRQAAPYNTFVDNMISLAPGFVNSASPELSNFQLTTNSPVMIEGFNPIAFTQIGYKPSPHPPSNLKVLPSL